MTQADPSKIASYCSWVREQALPRWAEDGFDRQRGRFRERLDLAGRPIDLPHRVMVQARQIFVFADAARRGWCEQGGALAETAMAGLIQNFMDEADGQASFAFSVDGSGLPASHIRDAYGHAFVLLSLAALYHLNGDRRLLDIADRTIAFIDARLADRQHGGLHDALPPLSSGKRQNPHMHMLEAYLFLDEAAPGRGYLDRAAAIVELFESRFLDPATGVLLEYFENDWSRHTDPQRARLWEPGHHFEWMWLLDKFASARGKSLIPAARLLHGHAMTYGVEAGGLVVDEVDSVGKHVIRASARIWPHTEGIKAASARHASGDGDAAEVADGMARVLLEHFLDRPFPGGWIDHISAECVPLVDYVPASSLYHLYLAATEASGLIRPSLPSLSAEQAA